MKDYLQKVAIFWLFRPGRLVFTLVFIGVLIYASFYDSRSIYALTGWIIVNLAWSSPLNPAFRNTFLD